MTKTVEVKSLKVVGGGVALAHVEGETWMVAGALPDEFVRARELRRRSGVVEAETLEVLRNPHPARSSEPCPHAGPCGGCDWPHVDAARGAALKGLAAAEAARHHPDLKGRIEKAPIHTSPLRYRLRSRLHYDPRGRALGFYAALSNSVHPLTDCRIVSPRLSRALPNLGRALEERCETAVDLEWLEDLEGATAIAALRRSRRGRPPTIDLVPGTREIEGAANGFHLLDDRGGVVEGWGRTSVVMDLPVPLEVPVGAFFQGNRHLVRPLFDRVAELVGPAPDPVWDLHAGVGFLAAAAIRAAPREVVVSEVFAPAAEAARRNLKGAQVRVGVTAEALLLESGPLPEDALVLVDPPRSGMSRDLRRELTHRRPARMVMLSCDPATWARDAAHLVGAGYRLVDVELFDLFPSTHHIEILSALEFG